MARHPDLAERTEDQLRLPVGLEGPGLMKLGIAVPGPTEEIDGSRSEFNLKFRRAYF
jgi:hypothetical protein